MYDGFKDSCAYTILSGGIKYRVRAHTWKLKPTSLHVRPPPGLVRNHMTGFNREKYFNFTSMHLAG